MLQFPFAHCMLLRSKSRLYVAVNCWQLGLLLNIPADLTALKKSSRWSWLSLYVNR